MTTTTDTQALTVMLTARLQAAAFTTIPDGSACRLGQGCDPVAYLVCTSIEPKTTLLANMSDGKQARLRAQADTFGHDRIYGDLNAHDVIEAPIHHWHGNPNLPFTAWVGTLVGKIPDGYILTDIITIGQRTRERFRRAGADLAAARANLDTTTDRIRDMLTTYYPDQISEYQAAEALGVDRGTVRRWLGK